MNTKRNIIGEVEQMAVDAIVHQPDERAAAEKHFSEAAKKIVETALQAVDIMEIGDVCRRAVTGASIQDYDLLAKLLTDKDFDNDRLAKAIEALASVKPVDSPPTFYTPGWLCELAKKMAAEGTASGQQQGKPTDDELHEAATEEPATVGCPSLAPGKVVVHDEPPAEATQQPELRAVRPQNLEDIGMTMDKRVFHDKIGEVVRIHFAGIRHLFGGRPAQLWEIVVSKNVAPDGLKSSHITVTRDHERVFSGSAFFGLSTAADVAISMMIRKIIGDVAKKRRDHFRNIRKATATTTAESGEVA